MVLHSRLVDFLVAKGHRIAVVSPNACEEYFQALCRKKGVDLYEAKPRVGLIRSAYGPARQYLFDDFRKNAALRAKHLNELRESPHLLFRWRARVGSWITYLARRFGVIPKLASRLEHATLGGTETRALLRRIKPAILVSTYPVNWTEAEFLKAAHRLGVMTVGQLLSWDNITCKGRFAVLPDRFITWGPVMTAELRAHYAVPAVAVDECGVAHFDAHINPRARELVPGLLQEMGLAPAAPYLFFGMSARYFCPHEIDIVEWVAESVRANHFGPDLQLLIRPHPQNMKGSMADGTILERLKRLIGPRVAIDYPQVVSEKLAWDLDVRDLERLAVLLEGCAVCLNSGSTLTIDAALHDKPVILTAFDGEADLPWWKSARRALDFPHLAKLLAFHGTAVARSYGELEQQVIAYLRDPGLHAQGRAVTRQQECGSCDGGASERIAGVLDRLACDCGT